MYGRHGSVDDSPRLKKKIGCFVQAENNQSNIVNMVMTENMSKKQKYFRCPDILVDHVICECC